MTPSDLIAARKRLRLSLEQMGVLLGYGGANIRDHVYRLESGMRPIRPPQQLLIQAYLSGYRPQNWPR